MESLEIARSIAKILNDKKGENIAVIKIGDISSIGDYFVIAGCQSTTQVKALADAVDVLMAEQGVHVVRSEGVAGGDWIVMDYITVLVHIFINSGREFYKLERTWADGELVDISDILTPDFKIK